MIKLYGDSIGKERPAVNELSEILSAYKVRVVEVIFLVYAVSWYPVWLFFGVVSRMDDPSTSMEAFKHGHMLSIVLHDPASYLRSSSEGVFQERFSIDLCEMRTEACTTGSETRFIMECLSTPKFKCLLTGLLFLMDGLRNSQKLTSCLNRPSARGPTSMGLRATADFKNCENSKTAI